MPELQSKYNVPLRQAIFDVVQRRVNQHSRIIPSTRFDSNSLVNQATLAEVLVRNCDSLKTLSKGTKQGKVTDLLCLLSKATKVPSLLQTTYFTGGVVISAIFFPC